MDIIQTYYNKKVSECGLNFSGGYLSPWINWLSMAYSCLLLKRHNKESKMILYANKPVVDLLVDTFHLPYDEYVLFEDLDVYAEWFYCRPKLVTYSLQKAPFIHIDTDVFIDKALEQKFHDAELIAQHEERDSTFYRLVYDNAVTDNIALPAFMERCYDHPFIKSYNAGLLGGKDLDFFKRYINEVSDFVRNNHFLLEKSQRKFLYNVLIEQWFFYALSHQENKKVSTYYDSVITDFKMPGLSVPQRIIYASDIEYLHIMEHKDNIRCNKYIAYRMATEFPDYYESITNICSSLSSKKEIFSDNKKDRRLKSIENELFLSFKSHQTDIKNDQTKQYLCFEKSRIQPHTLLQYKNIYPHT